MESLADKERLPREIVAMRVAKELPDGSYVNLGIGIPTMVSSFVPEGRTVFYHSESGYGFIDWSNFALVAHSWCC